MFSTKKDRPDLIEIVKDVVSIASTITYCDFSKIQDMPQISEPFENVKVILDELKFKNYTNEKSVITALNKVKKSSKSIIVTGSFYILEDARKAFME